MKAIRPTAPRAKRVPETGQSVRSLRARHLSVVFVLLVAAALVGFRSVSLAVGEHSEFLRHQGDIRSIRERAVPAHRGIIYDTNGEPLAVSAPMLSVGLDRDVAALEDVDHQALAAAVGLTVGELDDRLASAGERRFVFLARRLEPSYAAAIEALDLKSIRMETEYHRFYPAGETIAHVIGRTNIDDVGQEGIELAFESELKSLPGRKIVERDLVGRVIDVVDYVERPRNGADVVLSVDMRLQHYAYRELKAAVAHHAAASGSLVMLSADTGEILAMVNQPSFNPNDWAQRGVEGVRNRAIADLYEPGSTVKPFTALAALESGDYDGSTVVDTSPGRLTIGRKVIFDPSDRGAISVSEIVARSSQVGIAKMALTLPEEAVFDAFSRVGLGEYPGTYLPGEVIGRFSSHELDKEIVRVTLAYGYGLTVSPLQLARAYLSLANGGLRGDVSIVKGRPFRNAPRVFDEAHVHSVVRMMEGTVSPIGTAPNAAVPGHRVAGKSGTARKVRDGSYDDESHVAFFAGLAPVEDPKVVLVVVINEPQRDTRGGGAVAGPVFSRVVERALRVLGVPAEAS